MATAVKWKIRAVGQQDYVVLDKNPSGYSRKKQADVVYEELLTGGYSRVNGPVSLKQEEYQIIWPDIEQNQLDILEGYLNKKVEIIDHLLETSIVYIDGIQKKYLIAAFSEPRYAVSVDVTSS